MGSILKEFRGHTGFIHALAFDNHSQVICSGGLDKTVKFWDINSNQASQTNKSTNHSPNTPNTPKNPTNLTSILSNSHSNELINSTNIDFDVYSLSVDLHNVFYLSGARKSPPLRSTDPFTSSQIDSKIEKFDLDIKSEASSQTPIAPTATNRSQQIVDAKQPEQQPVRRLGVSTRKSSAASSSKQTNSSSNLNNSASILGTAGTNQVGSANNSSTSAAAAAANYDFLNNDDLYEV